jgi:hypothetical protein
MRNKLGILLTFTSTLSLLGCDKLIDETGDFAAGPNEAGEAGPGCESEYAPHPYLSCRPPEEWPEDPADYPLPDPACFVGCGGMQDSGGSAFAFCAVECEDASDCEGWDPGDSVVTCDGGHCKWFCDEDHACPSELECVSRGNLGPGDAPYWGECWAPAPYAL